ncbi:MULTISPECIES: hypothetical protein [Apibacter]|uniref:hypothetical protein n=1 Tax=Apibacter TaxID=1778601 RepID=UPI001C6A5F88|nr:MULTISPECIES: hypothetical protein [Apibacter]QYN50972.1 hypothetical protein GYM72_05290 [Apibacter sp. ESL0404]
MTVNILGGVDLSSVERLFCTLRISYQNYPTFRTTLDLYNDNQTDKLQRTLCDKLILKIIEVSRTLQALTMQLEDYPMQKIKFISKAPQQQFIISENDKKNAIQFQNTNIY